MEQQNLQDNTDIEIDVLELFHVLLNKFWIILLAGIIAGLAFIGGTILFITPQYESTTKMYVLSKQDIERSPAHRGRGNALSVAYPVEKR